MPAAPRAITATLRIVCRSYECEPPPPPPPAGFLGAAAIEGIAVVLASGPVVRAPG